MAGKGKGLLGRLIEAWHGSPHEFDKFDLSKMGTGEGAQAYGKGAYTSSDRRIGEFYRDQLQQNPSLSVGGKPIFGGNPVLQSIAPDSHYTVDARVESALRGTEGDVAKAIAKIEREIEYNLNDPFKNNDWANDQLYQARSILNQLPQSEVRYSAPKAHLYEVGLDVDPNKMLDWQVPLGKQKGLIDILGDDAQRIADRKAGKITDPQLDGLLAEMMSESGMARKEIDPLTLTGRDIYYGISENYREDLSRAAAQVNDRLNNLRNRYGFDPKATDRPADPAVMNAYQQLMRERDVLQKAYTNVLQSSSDQLYDKGIGGIKYMGEFSRVPEGARNYVSFNADDMKILNKYLHPATMTGAGAGILGQILNDEEGMY